MADYSEWALEAAKIIGGPLALWVGGRVRTLGKKLANAADADAMEKRFREQGEVIAIQTGVIAKQKTMLDGLEARLGVLEGRQQGTTEPGGA